MLAANVVQFRQPSTGFGLDNAPLPVLDLQTQPYRISQINQFDRSFADSQLKHEAAAARDSQRFLRRVTSKLARPDTAFTAAALSRHVESNGSAAVAQIYIEKLVAAGVHSSERFEVPGNLLITAAKNANLELVKLLASFSSINTLGLALNVAVLNRDRPIVRALLENGADTDHLPQSTLSAAASSDHHIFQFILQAPKQLPHHKFGYLCADAITNGKSDTLDLLLRRLPDYRILGEGSSKWNRDMLLQTALASQHETAFFAVAAATNAWPLINGHLFFHVLDYARPLIVVDMIDMLLDLCRLPVELTVQSQLEDLLFRCIDDELEDILQCLLTHSLPIATRVVAFACESGKRRILELLLQGNLQGGEAILSSVSTAFGPSAENLREKALLRLLQCHNRGPWTQRELLRATFMNQSHLIEPLIVSGASVNFNDGECLKIAISADNVSLVKALLAHNVALPILQSTFPLIGQSEPFSRRLITKLFLNKGVSGECVDMALNNFLCDYSPTRDVELLDILMGVNACCELQSLLIAMEHHDSAIFDKLRSSPTIRYNGAVEWFEAYHTGLFDQLCVNDSSSGVSSSYLMLFLHISGQIPQMCCDHGGARKYDCFHRLLERRTNDRTLLDICLNSMSEVDMISTLELATTISCFCDVETTDYLLSSEPFAKFGKNSPFRLSIELDAYQVNPYVQIPSPNFDITRFSDNRIFGSLTIFFQRYIAGTAAAAFTTRLLQRHFEELARCIGKIQWPLTTIEFLLSQPIEAASPEFEACLALANSYQQWTVFRRLCDRELPQETISKFLGPEMHSLPRIALAIILESAAISHINVDSVSLLQQPFEFACRERQHQTALLIASNSPHKLRITNVLEVLNAEINNDSAIEWFPTIISTTVTTLADLEMLWQSLPQDLLLERDQWRVLTLLSAGVTGSCVAQTLLYSVARGNHPIVSLILDNWNTDRCMSGRASFDFKERTPVPHLEMKPAEFPSSHAFFRVLGDALSTAVLNGDVQMCKLLVTAKAPLVQNEKVIIEDAAKSMDSDTLLAFISTCAYLDDFGSSGVDFALLQAVKCARPKSAKAMVISGGSILAYSCECLRIATTAACRGEIDMLETLTSLRPTEETFSFVAEEITRILKSSNDDPQRFCELFDLLHEKGFEDVIYYHQALLDLCGMKSTQWDHAQTFISYGARVEWSEGACMREAWRFGNLQLFPQLFHQCQEQSVLDTIFDSAVEDYTSRSVVRYLQSCEDALIVLAPLLITNLPHDARSRALSKVASRSNPDVAILELMLQTGALICETEGETLYRISRQNHKNINLLITKSQPPIQARIQALHLLLSSKDSPSSPSSRPTEGERDDLGHACLDLLIWPEATPYAFTKTKDHIALFNTMLNPLNRSICLDLIESFLLTPQGLGFVSTYCTEIGYSAMEDMLSDSIATSRDEHHDRQIGLIIKALQVNAPRVLAQIELQPTDSEQFFDCLDEQGNHASEEQTKTSPMYLPTTPNSTNFCSYIDGPGFTYGFYLGNRSSKDYQQLGLALPRKSMNRLLIVALTRQRLSSLISILLDSGADPNAVDSEGRSALYLATSQNDCSAVCDLVSKGASADDGSLHLATCDQHHVAMEVLLGAGHSIGHRSNMHQDLTVLEAFLRFDHREGKVKDFKSTLEILLKDVDLGAIIWQARPNLTGIALEGRWPFEFIFNLLNFRPISGVRTTLLRRGRFRYSLLSAVEKWDTDIRLTDSERKQLVARLSKLGFQRRYYASEGKQPSDAVGIPDRLLDPDSRSRRQAWKDKECSVCGDKPEEPKDVHAHLSLACEPKHGWQDEIICTDCLRQFLESKMFPSGDERFPSGKVSCWAPNCGEILSHPNIQKYAEVQRFNAYDDALCQQHLHSGKSIAKCAGEACRGAIWLDPAADKNVTVFACPICKHRTCIQCNQPYKKHSKKPCPAGEVAKANARRKEEEKLTIAFMKTEKKCPKCKMPYHRVEGCDHITCGKDTHSAARSCKFPPSFGYLD